MTLYLVALSINHLLRHRQSVRFSGFLRVGALRPAGACVRWRGCVSHYFFQLVTCTLQIFLHLLKQSSEFSEFSFTAPNTVHTSPVRFCMASVRNPICRLFSIAPKVVGPVTTILKSFCSVSTKVVRRITSA